MTTICELPTVGEVKWADAERDAVEVDGFTYGNHYLNSIVDDVRHSLARLLAVQEFIAAEAENSKWDCAGERAFVAHRKIQIRSPFALSWDELTVAQRDYWVTVAKAVLDGEH